MVSMPGLKLAPHLSLRDGSVGKDGLVCSSVGNVELMAKEMLPNLQKELP